MKYHLAEHAAIQFLGMSLFSLLRQHQATFFHNAAPFHDVFPASHQTLNFPSLHRSFELNGGSSLDDEDGASSLKSKSSSIMPCSLISSSTSLSLSSSKSRNAYK